MPRKNSKGSSKVDTETVKKMLGISKSGYDRIRKLYREKGRIEDYELFDYDTVVNELAPIIKMQRENPRFSFEECYNQVMQKNAVKVALSSLLDPSEEDKKGELINQYFVKCVGPEESDRFFELFNQLSDFVKKYDETSQKLLLGLQELIISNIILHHINIEG